MTNDNNHKLRAVILAALMVFSVIAMSGAAAGAITRGTANTGTGINYDVNVDGDGAGNITSGAVLFQGEDISDGQTGVLSFTDRSGSVNPAELSRADAAGGQTLSLPVPQDQARGDYSGEVGDPGLPNTQYNITVDTPRITTFDVNNNNTDVNGGILTTDQTGATVDIDFNFQRAEQIDLTIEDEDGIDVTNEFLQGGANATINATQNNPASEVNGPGDVTINISPAGIDEGEYTFTAEGNDDLAFGEASQSTTVTVSASQTASLEVGQDPAIQGDNVNFEITNSPEGNFHAVVIDAADFRANTDIEQRAGTFRSVGDTVQTGVIDRGTKLNNSSEYPGGDVDNSNVTDAFAIVEIDGGTGVGSIETQTLDDTSATVEVFPANGTADSPYLNGDQLLTDTNITNNELFVNSDDDSLDFEIEQGEVSITNPTDNYVVGSEITLEGEANTGVDEVAIYARDQSAYQLVPIDGENTVQVEGDNTFSEDGVVLSNISANNGAGILSIPGTYRLGVIDATDARAGGSTVRSSIGTTNFSQGVSSADSIVVRDTGLDGNFTTYNGQISTDDDAVNVQGVAVGKSGQGVAVVFVGSRGNIATQQVSVDDDGSFDQDDISLNDPDDLAQGTVTAHIISSGRDQTFGDNVTDPTDPNNEGVNALLEGGVNFDGIESFSGTQSQVNARIVANTVDDTGSDDLIVTETFRLADSLTTIESATSPVETNGTIEIEGQTNKQPDDNTIVIELLDDDDNVIESTNTDQWGTDGVYSGSLSISGVEPGNYTLESDDGDSTDRTSIQVVEQVQETPEPTPEPTPTEEPTPTATPEPTPTATPEPTPTATPTPTPTSTPTGTPGFGIVVALIALVAAALLAVRRNN